MKLFDLHCDTLSQMLQTSQDLAENNLHVSLKRASRYDTYTQIFAVWSNQQMSDDENYTRFFEIINYAASELKRTPDFIPYLAVEGGKLLNGDLLRLDVLHKTGVRFLTLVWSDTCCIGGAHNTDNGLSSFGRDVVKRCFDLNIIPDLSHASDRSFYEAYEIALLNDKPVIASHSNSRTVCHHRRNLTDDMFRLIVDIGGITGISLCRPHLTKSENCGIDSVVAHIEHYMSLGGEKTICLGCDLDGIDKPPYEINGIEDLYKIGTELQRLNYPNDLIENLFSANAEDFMKKNNIIPELNI
ncbi:MAG: membrane dipeptidase [Eubacteriales bacterium]|nr:membrane dipeptidase [Eubacteriales bacterium]